ncbi:hypothetical protein [Streptomyces sp. NPDC060035]|uniref:hypothetical protein n=1 Tax=Streptomyces sp. NPDC060035 TaxID=3347044 RepID=UPI0036832619
MRCTAHDAFGRQVAAYLAEYVRRHAESGGRLASADSALPALVIETGTVPPQAYDDAARLRSSPGTLVLPVRRRPQGLLVGPVQDSGRPCPSCLLLRNDQHQWGLEPFFMTGDTGGSSGASAAGVSPLLARAAAALAVRLALRVGRGAPVAGLVWHLEHPVRTSRALWVLPMPQCRPCAAPGDVGDKETS